MIQKECKYCGKIFSCKESENRIYCSRECYRKDKIENPNPKNQLELKRQEVTCAVCGKVELVYPSRAKHYLCCSIECLSKYNSNRYNQKIKCICEVCGKEFYLKPYYYNRATHHCCSKECSAILRKDLFKGENNHQFGLKGKLNSSFKDKNLVKKNGNLEEIMVYSPETPGSNSRITIHRKIVIDNRECFNPIFFDENGGLKPGVVIHHIDENHNNNTLENLIPLTKKMHLRLHFEIRKLKNIISSNTGVQKENELLKDNTIINQQSDEKLFSDSETRNILSRSVDLDKDIVQLNSLAQKYYRQSIEEINNWVM